MTLKTPYSRSPESNSRERKMRTQLVPQILMTLGHLVSDRNVNGMQMVTVQPVSGPPLVVWVKCAWKPGTWGNCAVQMVFPSKEDRAHTGEEAVNLVVEKARRAADRDATHLLLLAADNEGKKPLAAYMLPINKVGKLFERAVAIDESLSRNGASPSIYITANGDRTARLVKLVKKMSIDLLLLPATPVPRHDNAIEDLDVPPQGVDRPVKKDRKTPIYARDLKVRSYVLKRAKGCCEYCGEEGFLMFDGKGHYIEAHHIIALAEEGKDTVNNVIALCPQHHREAHCGANRTSLETQMIKCIKNYEE